jgi:hypothetical protein
VDADTVEANITFILSSVNNVENMMLTGYAAINVKDNMLANIVVDNSGANFLNGKSGNDNLNCLLAADFNIVERGNYVSGN